MSKKTSCGISPCGQYSPHASSTDACSLVRWTCVPTLLERTTSNVRTSQALWFGPLTTLSEDSKGYRHQKRDRLKQFVNSTGAPRIALPVPNS
eukprot:6372476-Amphidinium_carterae.2